jgi:hypothetical protein
MVELDPVLETHLRAAEGVSTLQLVATVAAAADGDNSCPVDWYR